MLKALHRISFIFYNFSGLFALNFDRGTFRISYFQAFLNIAKLLSTLSFVAYATILWTTSYNIFKSALVALPHFSNFSRITLSLSTVFRENIAFFLLILQLTHLRLIKHFMNEALLMTLNEKYLKKFENTCLRHFAILSGFLTVNLVVKYFSVMNPSILSFTIFASYMYPGLTIMSFVSFVKIFENFIVVSLKEFRYDLHQMNHLSKLSSCTANEKISKLAVKYDKIFKFVESFADTFGTQLTVVICCMTAVLVFCVRFSFSA